MARVNLVSNPSFKTDLVGWSATGGATAIARVTTDAYVGDACAQVTKAAVANAGVLSTTGGAVVVGKNYTASAYVRVPTEVESGDLKVFIAWYDAAETQLSISYSTAVTVADIYGWQRLAVTATAPTSAVTARVGVLQPLAGTANAVFLIDAVMLENSSYTKPYQDELDQLHENFSMDNALRRVPVPHLTGAELNADISLGSLVFNTVDENGVVWVITQVDGWWNLPEPQMNVVERGFADGQYDVSGRYTGRSITLTGAILPPDRAKLPAARARLLDAANLVKRGDWLKLDEDPTKAAFVRLAGMPTVDTTNQRGRTEFTIMLRAADPIKYKWTENDPDGYAVANLTASTVVANATTTVIDNEGSTDVTAIFELLGPIVGPNATLTNLTTGDSINIVGTLRPARTLDVTSRATDSSGLSTLEFGMVHDFVIGDMVTVGGVATGYNGQWMVDLVPTETSISMTTGRAEEAQVSSGVTGSVSMDPDMLEIDTYARETAVNGVVEGSRSMLDTLVDWITLQPGSNEIELRDDNQVSMYLTSWARDTNNIVTVTTLREHGLHKGDTVKVSDVTGPSVPSATITAVTADSFSYANSGSSAAATYLGPVVSTDYADAAVSSISYNNTTKTVTLTTADAHGIAVGEVIRVGGGDTTWGSPAIDVSVGDGVVKDITTYQFTTLTDTLRLNMPEVDYVKPTFSVTVGTNATLTTSVDHGLYVGQQVYLTTTGVLPGGLTKDTVYYYVASTPATNTLTLSATINGAAITTTATPVQSGTHTLHRGLGFSIGDTVYISDLGTDFDGYSVVTSTAPNYVTVVTPSSDPDIAANTAAPSSAVLYRVYRAVAVTSDTVTYVKSTMLASGDLASTAVSPKAGTAQHVGASSGRVLYRSGWMA